MKYAIYEENMPRLEKKLKRIENKCNKYGCHFTFKKVGEEFRTLKTKEGADYIARFIIIEAEGTAILNDWEFIASVEHTKEGNIITGISNVEVPKKYYTTKPVCEHCNTNRYRKYTYIVRNTKTHEFKQVGKSCLKDFTNGLSAEVIAQYISYFDTLIEGEAPYPGSRAKTYYNTYEYLLYVAETIRHFGYQKATYDNEGTGLKAANFYNVTYGRVQLLYDQQKLERLMRRVNFDVTNKETVTLVNNALSWIKMQEESSNYIHNLKTACSLEYFEKHFSLYASLFPAYEKAMKFEAKRKKQATEEEHSVYVGKIGDRITVLTDKITCLSSWETMFGTCFLYKIIGRDGNVYIWRTGKYLNGDIKNVRITGTVKGHDEYYNSKRTELTRCHVDIISEKAG